MNDGIAQILGVLLRAVLRKKSKKSTGRGGKPPDQGVERKAQSAGNETSEAKASLSE